MTDTPTEPTPDAPPAMRLRSIRVSDEQWRAIQAATRAEGTTVSQIARDHFSAFLRWHQENVERENANRDRRNRMAQKRRANLAGAQAEQATA